jgi:hypothetical protein
MSNGKRTCVRGDHIYQRKGAGFWYAYLEETQRGVSLHTTDEAEARRRFAALAGKSQQAGRKRACGWVYFVQAASGPVKIGWTKDIRERLKMLQANNFDTLTCLGAAEGSTTDEAQFHRRFGKHLIRGEWFQPAPEILEAARSVRQRPDAEILPHISALA